MSKILILTSIDGIDLSAKSFDGYDNIQLLTDNSGNLPLPTVMKLMELGKAVNIEFLQLEYSSENELMILLAFKAAQLSAKDVDTSISIMSNNLAYDSLINAAKKSNIKLNRIEKLSSSPASTISSSGQTSTISHEPIEVQKPVQPTIAPKPTPKVEPVVPPVTPVQEKTQQFTTVPPAREEDNGQKNKRLISSLLSSNK
jgi:hypothetical protein